MDSNCSTRSESAQNLRDAALGHPEYLKESMSIQEVYDWFVAKGYLKGAAYQAAMNYKASSNEIPYSGGVEAAIPFSSESTKSGEPWQY